MTREQRKIRNQMYREIRKRGWCQQINEDRESRVCLNGAYNIAIQGSPRLKFFPPPFEGYYDERAAFYRSLLGTSFGSVWNDRDNRTEKDVLRALCPWWMTWRYPTLRKTSHV